jgi:polar amino acid transport system substrate-binding protein
VRQGFLVRQRLRPVRLGLGFGRRARLVALVASTALAVAGCAVNASPINPANVTAASEVDPAGTVSGAEAVPPSAGAAANCGDPTASLSPMSPVPPPGHMPFGSTMASIQSRGVLVAGVDQNTYLFGYRDPATNNLQGFDIDMVNYIAQAIFGPGYRVQYVAINSNQRSLALQKHAVDIVVRTFTVNCARRQDVSFSSIYFNARQRLLVKKNSTAQSLNDLGGKKVCAAIGSDSLTQIANTPSHPIPVSVNDWSDCLVMLQQGEVDAVTTDDAILAGMAAQDPNLQIVGPNLQNEPYGIAMPLGDDDMVRFVNGVLDQLRGSGAWEQSYQHWLGNRLSASPPPPPAPTYSG